MDYPIADPDTGIGVLMDARFNKNSIMPICLPPNKNFKDYDRQGIVVGLGVIADGFKSNRCITDGNGPVAFQKCSTLWVEPDRMLLDEEGSYDHAHSAQFPNICVKEEPPSRLNKLCAKYHQKIENLK